LMVSVCSADQTSTITDYVTSWVPRNKVTDSGVTQDSALVQRVVSIEQSVNSIASVVANWATTIGDMSRTIRLLQDDVANRTTHQQVVDYMHRYVIAPFEGMWQAAWRRQWDAMTAWVPGSLPKDTVLVNFIYSRIRRYAVVWWSKPAESPETAGSHHYTDIS
jgi:hypothetical protein